ncbi:DUF3761 domain-containing protein [Deinococcus sp. UYEF24]
MTTARRLITLVALLLSAAASALQTTTTSNANLRAGPSTTARVLAVIPKGTVLPTEVCTAWCSTTYNNQPGFVSKSVLSFRQSFPPREPTSLPVPALPVSIGTYINVDGQQIQRPVMSDTAPAGASAHCRDGSYSFSTHRSGTCSHHGGVGEWL